MYLNNNSPQAWWPLELLHVQSPPNLGLKMKILAWKNSESSKNESFDRISYKQGFLSFKLLFNHANTCISSKWKVKLINIEIDKYY